MSTIVAVKVRSDCRYLSVCLSHGGGRGRDLQQYWATKLLIYYCLRIRGPGADGGKGVGWWMTTEGGAEDGWRGWRYLVFVDEGFGLLYGMVVMDHDGQSMLQQCAMH